MEKHVRWSMFGGVVLFCLYIVSALLFVVLDHRFNSFLYGSAIAVFFGIFLSKKQMNGSFTRFLSALCISVSVCFVIGILLMSIWPSFRLVVKKSDLSIGWAILGCILSQITHDVLLVYLYKRRKTRIDEEQRKARLAELMNK